MRVQTRGEFGGLGIEVTMENGFVKVVSPIDDTPAHRAGIEAGDLITHLDGESVMGLTLNEAVDRMRGKINTDLILTIRRSNEEPFDVVITRDVIRIQSVRSRVEGRVGYVRVTTFNQQTTTGLNDAVAKLKEEIGEDIEGQGGNRRGHRRLRDRSSQQSRRPSRPGGIGLGRLPRPGRDRLDTGPG
jgi:carboxyl-terminal processing protease